MKILKLSIINLTRLKIKSITQITIIIMCLSVISVSTNLNNLINEYIKVQYNTYANNLTISNILVRYIFILMIFIITIMIFSIQKVNMEQSANDKINEITIYKAIGYNNFHIFSIIVYEFIILTTIGSILSCVNSYVVLKFITKLINRILNINILIDIRNFVQINIFILLILYIICIYVSLKFIYKINKIQILKLLDN